MSRFRPLSRFVAIAAAAAVVSPIAVAATAPAHLPRVFARQIVAIDARPGHVAVLLPASMPLDARRVFASGGATRHGYDLGLGAVRGCGGANACFVAEFSAAPARRVYGRTVRVKGASAAGFVPLSCGASCAPPQIDFLVHKIRYVIQANLNTRHGDEKALVAAAEAAIAAGPR